MKITNSFLVVSNFNNDISWVPEYTDNYVIYNKIGEIPKNIDSNKVIESSKLGCAAYDWCKYISDNYENLPNRKLRAEIKEGNTASIKVAESVGFINKGSLTWELDTT